MAAAETARLIASLELDSSKFGAGVNKAVGSMGKLEGRLGKIGSIASRGAATAGRNLNRGLVLGLGAVAGALTYSAKSAIEWETAFTGVSKTVNATATTSLPQLEQQLLGLAKTMPVTSEDLAAIAEAAGAMGIKADDIQAFTRQVAILGATTDVSTEQAATAIGQLQNVIGLTGDEFDNFAASLVYLGNSGASTESQILEIARRSGGAAHLFGIAKEQTLGWASAAANLGINQELAGTALQNMFIKLLPKYSSGAKDLQKITGQTGAQLKKSFEKDAGGAVESLIVKLGSLPKDARLQAVQDLFGKGSGLTRLVLGLADSYDKNLKPSLDDSVKSWAEATAAQKEYDKRSATTQAQLQILGNNVKIAAATIGKELLPVIIDLAKEGVAFLDSHTEDIKRFAKEIGQGARDAVKFFKGVDWGAVAHSLQAGVGFAKGLVGTFMALPAPLQEFLAVGFAANKFTGGAVFSIVGELGKGLIGGFVGSLAKAGIGKAFVQPVFVTNMAAGGMGGAGAAGVTGGKGGIGAAIAGVLGAITVAAIADAIEPFVTGTGVAIHDALGLPTIKPDDVAWPFGPKDTPTILPEIFGGNGILGGTPTAKPAPGSTGGLSPDERQELNDQTEAIRDVAKRVNENKAALLTDNDRTRDKLSTQTATLEKTKVALAQKLQEAKGAQVAASERVRAATQNGTSAIVGAIRGIQRPIVSVSVVGNTVRTVYSTGGTVSRNVSSGSMDAGLSG